MGTNSSNYAVVNAVSAGTANITATFSYPGERYVGGGMEISGHTGCAGKLPGGATGFRYSRGTMLSIPWPQGLKPRSSLIA